MQIKRIANIYVLILLPLFSAHQAVSQNLEQNLLRIVQEQSQPREYMKGYLQPLATAIGISMGEGLYNFNPVLQFPHFSIGIGHSAVSIPASARIFYDGEGNKQAAIFGDKTATIPGFDLSHYKQWILQGNVGVTGNLEINLRYSRSDDEMLGIVNILGGGLRYGLSDIFIPVNLPMHLSVQAAYHYMLARQYLASGSFNMNLNTDLSIPSTPITITGAVAFNNSNLIVNTGLLKNLSGDGIGNVTVVGENGVRYHVGVNLQVWKIGATTDYSFGTYPAWYLGFYFKL